MTSSPAPPTLTMRFDGAGTALTTPVIRSLRRGPAHILRRHLPRVLQDEGPPLVVVQVDVAARVDGDFLRPVHRRVMWARLTGQPGSLWRHEVADFCREGRKTDVEHTQTRIEPRDEHQISGLSDGWVVKFLIGIVRSETSDLVAEVFVGRVGRRPRRR